MKKTEKQQKQIHEVLDKITHLTRHISNVESNCLLLGTKLIENGDIDLGHKLIANGYAHDISKFNGIEFEFMTIGMPSKEESAKLKLKMAIQHHQKTNSHHPEFWSNIKLMPKVYLCEFVCDIKARSEEFGTDLRQWIDENATKRYDFTKDDAVYKEIMEFVDILCPKPFENIS